MNTKNKQNSKIEEIVTIVFELSSALRGLDIPNPNDLWQLRPDRNAPEDFKHARELSDKLLDLVLSSNPSMLSDLIVLQKLVHGAAAVRLQVNISDEELEQRAQGAAETLIKYQARREVDIPVIALMVDGDPVEFGPVVFSEYSEEDRESEWWQTVSDYLGNSAEELLLSYGRVRADGDLTTSLAKATEAVREALLVIRGLGFPIQAQNIHQIGVVNDYPLWENTPIRVGIPKESERIEAHSRLVTQLGPYRTHYRLRSDILAQVDATRLKKFSTIIADAGFAPSHPILAKFISGLRWLGEATKPDSLSARFAKVAFALEALIGGESNEENLSTRGLTATLAERAAFLIGNDLSTRRELDKTVRQFYRQRSAIVHGNNSDILPADFEQFGRLTRRIAWGLFDHSNEFGNIDQMQSWVKDQRYSASQSD